MSECLFTTAFVEAIIDLARPIYPPRAADKEVVNHSSLARAALGNMQGDPIRKWRKMRTPGSEITMEEAWRLAEAVNCRLSDVVFYADQIFRKKTSCQNGGNPAAVNHP
jgi:hypothetical protein